MSAERMKKNPSNAKSRRIVPIDFRGGVRGKHYERYQTARVTVHLDPDVARAFPDDESVNSALRRLLADGARPTPPED